MVRILLPPTGTGTSLARNPLLPAATGTNVAIFGNGALLILWSARSTLGEYFNHGLDAQRASHARIITRKRVIATAAYLRNFLILALSTYCLAKAADGVELYNSNDEFFATARPSCLIDHSNQPTCFAAGFSPAELAERDPLHPFKWLWRSGFAIAFSFLVISLHLLCIYLRWHIGQDQELEVSRCPVPRPRRVNRQKPVCRVNLLLNPPIE
ncbi:hypothetical protein TWF481_009292 [Arthrobotrys musiformis]|uniref:Uncharacterized protein n=1 Tax=Arthrobotrys musiformis TaxID=47236 RepID=A0AAV9W4A6_9PEZI